MHPRLLLSPKLRRDFRAAKARLSAAAARDAVDWPSFQLEGMRRLWADAVRDIPYYAALVNTGRAPKEIRAWEDFQAVPVLTRQAIQDQRTEFLRRSGPPDCFTGTPGSTRTPLRRRVGHASRCLLRVGK